MPIAAAVPAIIGAGSSIAGGLIGKSAAGNAASAAAASAGQAVNYSKQNLQNARDFITGQQGKETGNLQPFLQTGQNATNALNDQLKTPGQGLLTPFSEQFKAPTDVTEQNDPGYQFRLAQGMKALQASAAAKGNLVTGGTANALQRYGQDYASGEYGNVYNRSMNEFQNRYNIFRNNQGDAYGRLSGTAGMGLNAGESLNASLGQNAGLNTNALLASSQQVGNDLLDQGAARASGYLGQGNAMMGMVNGIGSAAAATPWSSLFPSSGVRQLGVNSSVGAGPGAGSNYGSGGGVGYNPGPNPFYPGIGF